MSLLSVELDYRRAPIRVFSLRQREPSLDADVFETKLGDELLASGLFTASEIATAPLNLVAPATILPGASPLHEGADRMAVLDIAAYPDDCLAA